MKAGNVRRRHSLVVLFVAGLVWAPTARAQECVDPPSGLVAWWPGDGHALDIKGSLDGTPQNGATFAFGLVGEAFNLDGVNDYISLPDSGTLNFGTGNFTFDFWAWSSTSGRRMHALSFEPAYGTRHIDFDFNDPDIVDGSSSGLWVYWNSSGVNRLVIHPRNIYTDGRWHHFALTRNGTAFTLYVDGSSVRTTSYSSAIDLSNSSVNYIGAAQLDGPSPTFFWSGLIDEVEIYNRTLSASEIQIIFNAGSAGKCKLPVADAGPDQTLNEGSAVTLSGSGRDPLGESLTFSWAQVAGPAVTLPDSSVPGPSFTAPSVPAGGATLTFQLVVSSSVGSSEPDVVNVIVKNINHAPAAETRGDLTAPEGTLVTLDGSSSFDVDDEPLTYAWTQTAGTLVTLSGETTATPTFTAPAVGSAGETLTFQLVVNDGIEDSAPASVYVFVTNVNQAPTADAGADISANENTTVTLSGSGTDPDDDTLMFSWTQTGGSLVVLSDPTIPNPSFAAPFVASGGEVFTFRLVVSDDQLDGAADEVMVHVLNINDPPNCALAAAASTLLWPPNHKLIPVSIGGVVDPQGDAITIAVTGVTQDEPTSGLGDGDTGPDAVIQGDSVLLRAERWDEGNGRVYAVSFTATDGLESCSGTVKVTVPKNMKKGSSAVDDGQIYDSAQP